VPKDAAGRHDQIDPAGDEIGGQSGQPIIMALGPTVFDRYVLSLDVACFAQSLVERGNKRRKRAGRGAVEEADHRHRLLLRAGQESGYAAAPARTVMRFRRLIPSPSIRRWAWIMALQSHFRKAERMATFRTGRLHTPKVGFGAIFVLSRYAHGRQVSADSGRSLGRDRRSMRSALRYGRPGRFN